MEQAAENTINEFTTFFTEPNAFRSVLILLVTIVLAYWFSKIIAYFIIKVAQLVAVSSDTTDDVERQIRLRRVETYLSVAIALVRAVIVGVVAFYVWKLLSPTATFSSAAIGASAFFIVLAGGTIGMILRDITAGAAMIIEHWFHVGDFIRVEPFLDVSGVVERMTLRSTKLRSINGEVIWMHNQHIQAVKVTPRGVRTLAVDIFVNNEKVGRNIIEKAIETVPIGTMKVVKKPRIARAEQWGEKLYWFTVVGQMPPGREWLMENYFIDSLNEIDERRRGPKTLVRPAIARYADEDAERSFKRAVRMKREETKDK
ncbi:MAG TPA: mechanosensitive ion channel family protein [Candidatus Saccharibacteria bacterium]|nr:mechanosensitive ion channel family protein [Candidatus Saccharibacteria bacterium]